MQASEARRAAYAAVRAARYAAALAADPVGVAAYHRAVQARLDRGRIALVRRQRP